MNALENDGAIIEKKIKHIILHGTSNHPRAIQQAMSAFQGRWLVIKYRGLEQNIIPEILAILLLLPNDIFDSIFRYPSYFFYLHALATGSYNGVCTETQLQELYEMGIPKGTILNQHHQLSDLFSQYNLPETFNYDDLILHLTLQSVDATAVKADTNIDPVWDALNSKDPARIFHANHDWGDKVRSLFSLQMSTALTEIINQNPEDLLSLSEEKINHIQNAIIVAGFLDDANAIELLSDMLTIKGLPIDIYLRVLYSISHYCSQRGKKIPKVSQTLIDFISDSNRILRARVCAVRLIRHFSLDSKQVMNLIRLLENEHKNTPRILHNIILDTFNNFSWRETWETAIANIIPEKLVPSDVISLLNQNRIEKSTTSEKVTNLGQWPIRKEIVDYLINLSIECSEHQYDAFGLLRNHENQRQSMQWIAKLVLRCHEVKKSHSDKALDSLEDSCWNTLRDIQIKLVGQWQADVWNSVVSYLEAHNWPEEMIKFIPSILWTKSEQAIDVISTIGSSLPAGKWLETTLENLFRLSEAQKEEVNLRKKALFVYNSLAKQKDSAKTQSDSDD